MLLKMVRLSCWKIKYRLIVMTTIGGGTILTIVISFVHLRVINTTLIYEGEFTTTDVPTLLEDIIPNAEYLYVEVEDPITGQVTGVNLQSSEWIDSSVTKKVETLNVISDKKQYLVGDTAQVRYKAAKGSKAIITIEKAGK